MPKEKTRKIRVTKQQVREILEEKKKSTRGRKNRVIPGPWTEVEVNFSVEARIRWSKNFIGRDVRGTFIQDEMWSEKSWYPIIVNITSDDISEKVSEFGLDNYLAACEKSLNDSEDKEKDHGKIVLLSCAVDNSHREKDPFVSCRAKTNRKNIRGFSAIRSTKGSSGKKYIVIGEDDE